MKSSRWIPKQLGKAWMSAIVVSSVWLSVSSPSAYAGKEGVFLGEDTYFTLEQVSLSSGSDASSMQFSLKLHNGSGSAIDFNDYGIRVLDGDDNRYPVKLSSKQSARVLSGEEQEFRFYSSLGAGKTADQLKVELFAWDTGEQDLTREIGALFVASALSSEINTGGQAVIRLKEVDPASLQDGVVTFQLGRSSRVMEGGKPYLYVDLYAANGSTSTIQLPSALQFRVKDADGLTYTASLISGQESQILPNDTILRTVKAAIPQTLGSGPLTLQLYKADASDEKVFGSIDLTGSRALAQTGSEQPLTKYGKGSGLTLTVGKAVAVKRTDGVLVQSTVNIRNDSDQLLAIPAITGSYQFGKEGNVAASAARSTNDSYLSPKDTVDVYFAAVLPDGIDPTAAELAVWTKESAGSATVSSGSGNAGNSANATVNTTTNTSSNNAAAGVANGSVSSNQDTSGMRPVMIVGLQEVTKQDNAAALASSYLFGAPLQLTPNSLIDPKLGLSLVELHMHKNSDFGYNTAIAKVKMTNYGSEAITLPDMGTELINGEGFAFSGTRQTTAASSIMPGTSSVISYSYLLPLTETGEQLAFSLTDSKTAAPQKLSIGTYKVAVQKETDDKQVSFYPFLVTFGDYNIATLYDRNQGWSYQLDLNLNVDLQEQVIVDQSFSKMEFDLVDSLGRVLGSTTKSFTGDQKLVTGKQTVAFSNITTDQYQKGLTVKVYETIDTPAGPAKRLVKEFRQ